MAEPCLAAMIGRNILFSIYKNNFKKSVDSAPTASTFDSFNDFCNKFLQRWNHNEHFIRLGTTFIDIFTSQIGVHIFERRNINDEGYFLYINKDYIDQIQNNLILNPQSLPMISQPNLWSEQDYGGFILNKAPVVIKKMYFFYY